ncbi:MAG: DUF4105 domain-containing protein [Arcobacter sp.]|nr:DUF4105 domain-containing protein [Arcobacter sp.]
MQNICNKINKATKIFFLSSLFFLSCFSNDSFYDYVSDSKLYKDEYFLKLLHYKNNKSEIDSDNFFISKDGKTNPKKELFKSIDSLLKGKDNFICRFPLRTLWLEENIPNLKNSIKKYHCEELEEYLKQINPKYITLVFPTAHINSPASMYGHTFLRIGENKDTPLISNAINYAAKTTESNGFIFAFKGIFGGYEGRYSILPYYEKIKEYSNLEQRDVWEYELDFTQEEAYKIALHAYELRNSFAYYYFFSENCSYNLLWLLEIGKPHLDLVSKFNVKAVPLDTIKVLKPYDLIKSSKFRYSKMSKMKYILSKIKNKSLLSDYLKVNSTLSSSLNNEDKIHYFDFKIEYLQYMRRKNKISQKLYLKKYIELLKQRSSYKKISTFDIKDSKNPLFSHSSSKFSLGYETDDIMELSLKPVYNDIYDVNDGYLAGAYIDFLKIDVRKERKKVFLDKLSVLDIQSYAKIDDIFKPISWGINLAYERFKHKEDYLKIKPQFGVTFGNNYEFLYLMLGSNAYIKANDDFISINPKIGLVSNRFDKFKFGASFSYDKYSNGLENTISELFSTYKITENVSFNLKYINDNLEEKRDKFSFSFFFYF